MLYTLSYWKKENLKVSSVTLFWLRDSSSQVPRVMSCLFFFTWLFFCSFVFVISSNETLKSQNLFKPETLSRVYVTVTNSTNTPRAYCIMFVDPWKLVWDFCSSSKGMCKISLKAIENWLWHPRTFRHK